MTGPRGVLGSLARFPRWLVVDLPCRFWLVADDHAPTRLWRFVVSWLTIVAVAGGLGAVTAAAGGTLVEDGLYEGVRAGLWVVLAWLAYAVLYLTQLWFRGVSPSEALDASLGVPPPAGPSANAGPGSAAPGSGPSGRAGRHVRRTPPTPWRRPGEPILFPVRRRR